MVVYVRRNTNGLAMELVILHYADDRQQQLLEDGWQEVPPVHLEALIEEISSYMVD